MTGGHTEHPAADVLRVLAVSRSSGALEIRGAHGGVFFLHDGDITYAEALGIPAAQTIDASIVDAGLILLTGPDDDGERPLFRPGRRHRSGVSCRIEVHTLLTEIADRVAEFRTLGVGPDDEVRLRTLPPGATVVLDRRQWALAAGLTGTPTPRDLAWQSGTSLGAAIATLASLISAEVLELKPRQPVAPRPSPSSQPALRRPEPPVAGGQREVRLPQRVRGSTQAPRAPDPRARLPPVPDDRHALAVRLLEGLRRL